MTAPSLSFSIVIETENLARAEAALLDRCLASLAAQAPSPARANEVVLVHTGDVPEARLERLRARYPWVTLARAPDDTGYYEAKTFGAARATGEIVVFADSDCRYEPNWLGALLAPFADPAVAAVAGETSITIEDGFSFAVALTWGFTTFSRRAALHEVGYYAANNAAFRRALLNDVPIPREVPVYRLKCATHAVLLRRRGYRVWKQDGARTLHPIPAPRGVFLWRYLVAGGDGLAWQRVTRAPGARLPAALADLAAVARLMARWSVRPLLRLPRALAEDPRRLRWLPLALPLAATALAAQCAGAVVALVRPEALLRRGVARLQHVHH